MRFRILGPVRVADGDGEDALRGTKQRTVLATLLLADGRVVTDHQLGDRLWDGFPPATADAQICTYVSRLRRLFDGRPAITRHAAGYHLAVEGLDRDDVEFARLARDGAAALRDGRPAQAAALLRQGLALWRGPALQDATTRLIEVEAPRLQEARMTALEARIEADLALGRQRQLTAELAGLVAAHPLRERLRAQLMTALYRCDRQAEAIAAYHEGRVLLTEELGVDPGPELTDTYQRLLTGALALPRAGAWSGVTPAMLPAAPGDFTGREPERAAVGAVLRGVGPSGAGRVVVVTGMPGIGKTSLAVFSAHAHAEAYPDGHLYAELHSPTNQPVRPVEVLGRFLTALGTPQEVLPAGLEARIPLFRSLVATKRMLIVLDDAETADQVVPLLPGGGGSSVVITSQTPATAPPGARVVALDTLSPDEARALFGAIVGERRLATEPAAAERILRCCAGLPLALRIAGSRLVANPGWALADLARRLEAGGGRVDELRSGDLDLRQRLQRGYSRLDTGQQTVLRLLARGEAAVRNGYAGLDLTQILDDLAERDVLDAGPRYRMHELTYLWARSLNDAAGYN